MSAPIHIARQVKLQAGHVDFDLGGKGRIPCNLHLPTGKCKLPDRETTGVCNAHVAGAGRVRLFCAVEAEPQAAAALRLAEGLAVHSHRSPAVRHAAQAPQRARQISTPQTC